MKRNHLTLAVCMAASLAIACGEESAPPVSDAGTDTGNTDGGATDGGNTDGGNTDTVATNTLVDVIGANADLSTLSRLIAATGIDTTLSAAGPFTVFAPTNTAIENAQTLLKAVGRLDAGTDLTATPPVFAGTDQTTITAVLQYHVLGASVASTDVATGTVASVVGWSLFVTNDGTDISFTGQLGASTVTTRDVAADNGVIHIVDAVIAPPTFEQALTFTGYTSLVAAITAEDGDAKAALADDTEYTLFAPTNAAFDAIDGNANDTLDAAGLPAAISNNLSNALLFHAIPGTVASADVATTTDQATGEPNGATFNIDVTAGTVTIEDNDAPSPDATVTGVDLFVLPNGTAHGIDNVLFFASTQV